VRRLHSIVLLASALLAPRLPGHMMSMSTGDLVVKGNRASYELRMPDYEIAHVKEPHRSLFEHIRFRSGGQEGRAVRKSCRSDPGQAAYICTAEYEFPAAVEVIDVECTFHSITVPNHVHLLRAENEGKRDQAIFDFSFAKATLRFRPPSAFETAVTQSAAGFARALGGLVQILFLASLVLAGRSRRELVTVTGMFLAGQIISAALMPMTRWQPAPRFVEAAIALTLAYLAIEILLLPKAGARWLIAGVLGAFHGLYFALFLESTGYRPVYVLAGVALAEILAVIVFALVFTRIMRVAAVLRPVQVSASVLLVVGMVWFFMRLRS